MRAWFQIWSELFVNLAAGWFILVFIEPQISPLTLERGLLLTVRFFAGIVALGIPKLLREEANRE